jgi:hypothetical protein
MLMIGIDLVLSLGTGAILARRLGFSMRDDLGIRSAAEGSRRECRDTGAGVFPQLSVGQLRDPARIG